MPKQNANGARNRFYDNMREVSPGDIVVRAVDYCALENEIRPGYQ